MADVVISEFMDQTAVDALARDFEVLYDPSLVDNPERLGVALGDAAALIVRNRTRVDESLLHRAPRLRVVGRLGVGLDNIDLDACKRRSIHVRPATGANADAVAEYVVAAAFLLRRGVFAETSTIVAGAWPRTSLVGHEVTGATMGLIGFGDIARRVAWRSLALGMEVLAYDPYIDDEANTQELAVMVPLDDLLSRADVISVHVPLTESTTALIARDAFARMKGDAVLINTSRGGVVDERSLVDALRTREIAGAALDVFATEPVTEQSGAMFAGVPGLVLTPHIAGVTKESNARVSEMVALAVRDVLSGEAPA